MMTRWLSRRGTWVAGVVAWLVACAAMGMEPPGDREPAPAQAGTRKKPARSDEPGKKAKKKKKKKSTLSKKKSGKASGKKAPPAVEETQDPSSTAASPLPAATPAPAVMTPPAATPPAGQDPYPGTAVAESPPPPVEKTPGFLDHFELRHSNTLEVRYDRFETPILGLDPEQNLGSAWLFSNETLICNFGVCNGSSLVFRPRLSWQFAPREDPDFSFHELYLSVNALPRTVVRVGKQVQGWGPGIFYSPTNRVFPETIFTTAQREPVGRRVVSVSVELLPEMTLFVMGGRADDSGWGAQERLRSYFASSRVEYQAQGEFPFTLGAVVGGGERFQPHGGMYFEMLLSDAWTVGAELSTSRGYARERDPSFGPPGLFALEDAWGYDGVINLRYGLSSGGEVGAEVGVNRFALSASAREQLPTLYPLLLVGTAAGVGTHPFLDKRYALVQGRFPELPPGRRVTFSASLMYTDPSNSLVAAGELSSTYGSFKGFVSGAFNFGPEASVQRFPFERFLRVGLSFTH
jgi:hypothetical protein